VRLLGISAFYHDSAAALVEDGRLVAAAQEERFSRQKHDARFPHHAVAYCLAEGRVTLDQLDHVVFYDKPFLKFDRLVQTYLAFAPRGFTSFRLAMPLWLREKLFQKPLLLRELAQHGRAERLAERLLFTEHHLSHAASAFFPSPFAEAAVLTLDGVGEWATGSVALGRRNDLRILKEMRFPHSLGLLYSAFTYYTGFKVNSGEYKLMGLAPYGQPRFVATILDALMDLKPDGSFRLNLDYFDYCTGLTMTNGRFDDLFGGPPRQPDERLTQRHMDLAASIQSVTEEVVLRLARTTAKETGADRLCLAGGVALNCVANGKLLRERVFKDIWIQPAAGDAGGAVGAALAGHYLYAAQPRTAPVNGQDAMHGSFLGPAFAQDEIERRLRTLGAHFEALPEEGLLDAAVTALEQGQALGWFQGRMEFGPRALGARSILGDPRSPTMQSVLNLKVKYRESFRPFAPAVLREHAAEWFELDTDSPYMLLVAPVRQRHRLPLSAADRATMTDDPDLCRRVNVVRSTVPAVTHVDYSARLQTVDAGRNPLFHRLLTAFYERTGCPILVNTSFNVRGEPIACTPEDAFRCFMGTELDALAIGRCFLRKEKQNPALKKTYAATFEPD
jgi:carbamoyltransferase